MTTDTEAALKVLLEQVKVLTDTVTAQQKRLDGLHDFNSRIIDEKKDLERKTGFALIAGAFASQYLKPKGIQFSTLQGYWG